MICLDYGHGGKDPGAIYGRRKEATDALWFGKLLKYNLKMLGREVDETRKADEFLSLKTRVAIGNSKAYDSFISIHRNAFEPEKASGVEIYIAHEASYESLVLAQECQRVLVKFGFKDRGIKRKDFYVLKGTSCPAILIELGFIDSSRDNYILDTSIMEIGRKLAETIEKNC